jgi:hypothetical protein
MQALPISSAPGWRNTINPFIGGWRMAKRTLLVVTPFCSPNFAYPAPSYLARFLRRNGREVAQADMSLETLLGLFCPEGLERVFAAATLAADRLTPATRRTLELKQRYVSTINTVIHYLQGHDPSIAYRICHRDFLPRGENFYMSRGQEWWDGTGNTVPIHDRAKYLGTLYLYDIAALVRQAIFPYFQITGQDRYHDDFVHWCATFDRMRGELERPPNAIDQLLIEALDTHLESFQPDLVGVTVPFARNLYWALRIGKRVKEWNPKVKVAAGGGLFNTSMRRPSEPRLFDYIDFLSLDDGERPLLNIVEYLEGQRKIDQLKRTFYMRDQWIQYSDGSGDNDASHEDTGAPDYSGYNFSRYFSAIETTNVNQRLYSESWWNKLTMAHGCYWKKCSFCDIHLSYIGDYETAPARNLVDKVEEAIAQTGHTGFHFVDEALPPKIMRDFALEVLRRGLHISWHGMLRFDRAFTPDLCRLLAASGLVAVFGGLEVASDRLLKLMKKGTSVEQVAMVCKNFQEAGIRVHAYIMYGFPTQTAQETIDAADVVRQLFRHGLITSASWAKFGVTPHSPIGRNPREYGIEVLPIPKDAFIEQVLAHWDPANDHARFAHGLEMSLLYYGLGMHHLTPTESWFDFPVPEVSIDRELLGKVLQARTRMLVEAAASELRTEKRALWLGGPPALRPLPYNELVEPQAELILRQPQGDVTLPMPSRWALWLADLLTRARPAEQGPVPLPPMDSILWEIAGSSTWWALRHHGLILTDAPTAPPPPKTPALPQQKHDPVFAIVAR